MEKEDCLKWAKALINGKYKKLTGAMSNVGYADYKPTSCCCLGVLNETLKPKNFKKDRLGETAEAAEISGIISDSDPFIFDVKASEMNDGNVCSEEDLEFLGIPEGGLTHEQIGLLLLLAIESGEHVNI